MNSKNVESVRTSPIIPYWVKIVILFFFGWLFMYANRMIVNPVMGLLKEEFRLNNTQLGALNSIFFLSYVGVQIPFGILGDKYGRRKVIVPGFVLYGLLTGISGWMKTTSGFFFARFLTGLGQGTYYGPQYALSSEVIPAKYRSLGSAIINSGMAFGIAWGMMSSSYMALEKNMGWRMPFYFFSIPTMLVGVLMWFVIKDEKNSEGVGHVPIVQQEKVSVSSLLYNKNLICIYIMAFCSLYGFFMLLTWLPMYLQTQMGIHGNEIGYISSLAAWTSIPGALFFSSLSDKMGRRKPFIFFLVPCAALSFFAIIFFQNLSVLIAALIFYGLTGKLALDPVLVAFVADHAPKSSYSTAFGIYNFIGMLSAVLAPYMTGYIADKTGNIASGFYIAIILLIIGMIAIIFAKDTHIEPKED